MSFFDDNIEMEHDNNKKVWISENGTEDFKSLFRYILNKTEILWIVLQVQRIFNYVNLHIMYSVVNYMNFNNIMQIIISRLVVQYLLEYTTSTL